MRRHGEPSLRRLRKEARDWLDSGLCDEGRLYHVTHRRALPSIRAHGLQPDQGSNFSGFEDWAAGKVFFAAGEDALDYWRGVYQVSQKLAWRWSPGDLVILRLREGAPALRRVHRDYRGEHDCSFFVPGAVPAVDLEVEAGGKWQPLVARSNTRRKRRRLRPISFASARSNPLMRPEIGFQVFIVPWGRGHGVLILDGEDDIVGGITLLRDKVFSAVADRGFGPLVYDAAATGLDLPVRPSRTQTAEAKKFWARQGGEQIPPLSFSDWNQKYGLALSTLRVDDPTPEQMRHVHEGLHFIEELASEAHEDGNPVILLPRAIKRKAREEKMLMAAEQEPTSYKAKSNRRRVESKRARRNGARAHEIGSDLARRLRDDLDWDTLRVVKWVEGEVEGAFEFPRPLVFRADGTFKASVVNALRSNQDTMDTTVQTHTAFDFSEVRQLLRGVNRLQLQRRLHAARDELARARNVSSQIYWQRMLEAIEAEIRQRPKVGKQARRNPSTSARPLFLDILAHLHALRWLYWTTHWTAAGPNFYGTHLLLQRLYEGKKGGPDINEETDQLGERMVAYFGNASVNPVLVQQRSTQLLQTLDGNPLRGLLRLEESLQVAIRRAWDAEQAAGNERSLGIDDYLMSLANDRDTARYLLRRTLG